MHILYFTIHAWYVLCGFNPNKEKRDADPDLREEQYFIFFPFFLGQRTRDCENQWTVGCACEPGAWCEL